MIPQTILGCIAVCPVFLSEHVSLGRFFGSVMLAIVIACLLPDDWRN